MNQPARAIGIDIGGTKIAVAAIDESGAILARTTIATEAELGFDIESAGMVPVASGGLAAVLGPGASLSGET